MAKKKNDKAKGKKQSPEQKTLQKTLTDEEVLQYLRKHEDLAFVTSEPDSDNDVGEVVISESTLYEREELNYLAYDSDNDNTILNEEDAPDNVTESPEDYDSDDNESKLSELKTKYKPNKVKVKN